MRGLDLPARPSSVMEVEGQPSWRVCHITVQSRSAGRRAGAWPALGAPHRVEPLAPLF